MRIIKHITLPYLLILLLGILPIHAAKPTVVLQADLTTIDLGGLCTLNWTSVNAVSATINQGIGSVPLSGSLSITPSATATYKITVKNGSGVKATAKVKITVRIPVPIVTFGSSPDNIVSGQRSTLSWTTSQATSVSINQGIGEVDLNGSMSVKPAVTTTYKITAKGKGGTVKVTTTVTVAAPLPTVSIDSVPQTIEAGESSTLSWSSTNATSVSIDNDVGEVDLSGSLTVSPSQTTTYTITASNGSGAASAAVTIAVGQIQPQVILKAFPSVVLPGEEATLCWRTKYIDSAGIDNDVGEVAVQGAIQVGPTHTTTYTIMVSGQGGSAEASATVEVDDTLQPSVSLYANPAIAKQGDSIVLAWKSLHAQSAEIDNGVGGVPANGSLYVTPDGPAIYTITISNPNGTATASAKVDVKPSPKCHSYIPSGPNNTVTVIDNKSMSVVKTLPVGSNPSACAVSPDGMRVYVGNDLSSSISVIDTGSHSLESTIAVGVNPKYLALSPSGQYLYVANDYGYNIIEMVDTGSGRVLEDLHLGGYYEYVQGMAIHPNGSRLYVAVSSLPDLGKVVVVDTASNVIMFEIPVSVTYDADCDVAVSPDGSRLYWISGPGDNNYNFCVLDTATNCVIKNKKISMSNGSPAQLLDLVVTHDGSKIYVIAKNDSAYTPLTCIDAVTFTASKVAHNLSYQKNIGAHPDGSRVFVVGSTFLSSICTDNNGYCGGISLKDGSAAHGNFMGYIADTVAGKVTNNGAGVAGVTVTANGEDIVKTALTNAGGNYSIALGSGTYTVTPSKGSDVFSPQNWRITVKQSLSSKNFTVIDTNIAPTITLQASPVTIMAGSSATLSWTSTNAATAVMDNGIGDVLINGSITVTPAITTTYSITVSNTVLTAAATVKVTVILVKPTVTISASPASIESGQSSTLTWTSTNATSASIDNGVGIVPVSGTATVTPAATTKYTITVTGPGSTTSASATVTVGYDTSANLTGTVTDYATSQPLADVTISALDASGVLQTALTDATGKYSISSLRVGNITVSFAKSGYNPYQQTINIPSNTTIELTIQLQQTQVGAILSGTVKDGQTNLPIAGAIVTITYSGSSWTSTSAADGSYIITNIPLGISTQITAAYPDYRSSTINLSFSQNGNYIWDFVLFNNSAVAVVQGKFINAKTLLPEAGVKVTHEETNTSTTTSDDGMFIIKNVMFGEQTFSFEKPNLINEALTYSIKNTPFLIELIKPNRQGVQIKIGTEIDGIIKDLLTGIPLQGAVVKVIGLNVTAITDQNGHYSLSGLPEGNYPMVVMASDHAALEVAATVIIGESSTANFPLYPLTRGLIKGTITDAVSGDPVSQASVEIDGNALLSATSEDDGTYKLVGIPPGVYKLKVTHAEYIESLIENIEIQDMSPTTIDIQLNQRPQTGALEGKIVDVATNNPVSGASVTVLGTSITATSDANGSYLLTNVPAGLNYITISASGYPSAQRIRAVNADESITSPTTTSSDIFLDSNNGTVDEKVSKLIKANDGGNITSIDSRLSLHIFPGSLSADAIISLDKVTDEPNIAIGDDLPLDPDLGLSGIKASSIMTQIEIAPAVQTDPLPTINGLVVIAARYSQKDADEFQLDENTAFPYTWNGSHFTALNPRPYELAIDKVNNIAYAAVDISTTIFGDPSQFSRRTLLKTDPTQDGSVLAIPWAVKKFIIGKALKASIFPPKPNIKIFDKDELDCVKNASDEHKPNPNALPIIFIHGFDPRSTFMNIVTNPNNEERYKTMLEDLVAATNGVYRPVFISFNTEAKIASIGRALAEKFYGEYLNKNNHIKGLPADPDDPDSGTFPYVDTFAFSMGGLVSRVFVYGSSINKIHNMIMIGTPNHGTFFCLKHIFGKNFIKLLNVGVADQLDYDDNTIDGFLYNPFLYALNSPNMAPFIAPRGDINLFAGTDESAWHGFFGSLLESPHDSFVPVRSVFCRPTGATLESNLSLLKEHKPGAIKYEHSEYFNHDNVGSKLKQKQISEYITDIALGLSDWIVERVFDENSNIFVKPTKIRSGFAKSKVKVEYNVWDGSKGRPARDIDRVVLVIYHKDGNDHWHISEPNGGGNGADSNGNTIDTKVKSISGNSSKNDIGPRYLDAVVNFDPNPEKGESGYDPEKDIVEVVPLVIALKPGKMTVPLDPTKVNFRIPRLNE